jgi:nitroreductase
MDFSELTLKRQSNRKYAEQPVEEDIVRQCLEAARMAPSANNAQNWHFIVVTDTVLKQQVAEQAASLGMNKFVQQSPVIVAVVAEKPVFINRLGNLIQNKDYVQIDLGIAVEHLCLQAADLGLGSCIVGWFNEKAVKKLLQIPTKKRLLLLVTLGYPADQQRAKSRKPFEQVVSFNRYNG